MSEHQHDFNRWVVTTQSWECACGATKPAVAIAAEALGDSGLFSLQERREILERHENCDCMACRPWTY